MRPCLAMLWLLTSCQQDNTCKTTSDCPGGRFCTQGICTILLIGVDSPTVGTGPMGTGATGAVGETSATGETGNTGPTGIVSCGAVGEACCASSSCNGGALCNGTTCVACGGLSQPCCGSFSCSTGVCSSSSCVACGGLGQPCCAGNTCSVGGRCSANSCAPCGAPGQVCCDQGNACERLTCNGSNVCPPVVALVQVTKPGGGTYGIDKFEVTRAEYTAWLNTAPSLAGQPTECAFNNVPDGYLPGDGNCVIAAAACASDSCPQTCLDWCDARAYCVGVGKRLCGSFAGPAGVSGDVDDASKQQWFNACSNGGTTTYSTGASAGSCRTGGVGQPAPVGVVGCESIVDGYKGVFDLNGNVFEWIDLCLNSTTCYALGGNFNEDPPYESCAAPPNSQTRTGRFTGVGFRCCAP